MIEPLVVTFLPIMFLIVLFGGGAMFRRKNINMDGEPPIGHKVFYLSKYSIVLMWGAMILQSWGVNLSFITIPPLLQVISVCLWVFGFALLFIGRLGMGDSFRIGSPQEKTGLKVNGLFRFSRNPMYLGVYSTLLASVLFTLNPLILLIGIFIVVAHHRIVLAEEQHLRNVFGKEYLDYCSRVRRYI
jgi:protein-S-isoprenylcysteine O-methyltransferase Ste14